MGEIRKAKMAACRQFAGDLNRNIWGKAFKWAKNGSRVQSIPASLTNPDGSSTKSLDEMANLLLDTFFPEEAGTDYAISNALLSTYGRTVDQQRVKTAIWRMKPLKATGIDGITAGMLKKAWPILGNSITHLFENCITKATFSIDWKRVRLVVIPKAGKSDMASSKTYRPISLLRPLAKPSRTL
jgi:hypothetical protein